MTGSSIVALLQVVLTATRGREAHVKADVVRILSCPQATAMGRIVYDSSGQRLDLLRFRGRSSSACTKKRCQYRRGCMHLVLIKPCQALHTECGRSDVEFEKVVLFLLYEFRVTVGLGVYFFPLSLSICKVIVSAHLDSSLNMLWWWKNTDRVITGDDCDIRRCRVRSINGRRTHGGERRPVG